LIKVKTFTQTLEIFKTRNELEDLDALVNDFLAKEGVKKVISVLILQQPMSPVAQWV
jgi:hypothetical protein